MSSIAIVLGCSGAWGGLSTTNRRPLPEHRGGDLALTRPRVSRSVLAERQRALCPGRTLAKLPRRLRLISSPRMPPFKQDIRFTHSADGARLAYAVHGEGY